MTLEIAGIKDLDDAPTDDFAFGFEYRTRLAHRIKWQVDSTYSVLEDRDDGVSFRTEIRYQF